MLRIFKRALQPKALTKTARFSAQTMTPRRGYMSPQQQGTANAAPASSEFKNMQHHFISKAHGAYSNMFGTTSLHDQRIVTRLIEKLHKCEDSECIMGLMTKDVNEMLNRWGNEDKIKASFVKSWR